MYPHVQCPHGTALGPLSAGTPDTVRRAGPGSTWRPLHRANRFASGPRRMVPGVAVVQAQRGSVRPGRRRREMRRATSSPAAAAERGRRAVSKVRHAHGRLPDACLGALLWGMGPGCNGLTPAARGRLQSPGGPAQPAPGGFVSTVTSGRSATRTSGGCSRGRQSTPARSWRSSIPSRAMQWWKSPPAPAASPTTASWPNGLAPAANCS